jgi:DNA cross-link repair 1A protein
VQVIKCIWNHPDAPVVYLACDLLGQEDLLREISKCFQNAKIYADKSKLSEYITDLTIVDPDLLTDCQDLTRFQVQFLSITLVMCVS